MGETLNYQCCPILRNCPYFTQRFTLEPKEVLTGIAPAGNLTDARYQHRAVLVDEYTLTVIVFGGLGSDDQVLASTESLNYTNNSWSVVVSLKSP